MSKDFIKDELSIKQESRPPGYIEGALPLDTFIKECSNNIMNKILVALVLAVGLSGNVYSYELTEKELREAVNHMNTTMPRTFPNGVLLESVAYVGSFTLVYNYRYSQHSKNSIGDTSVLHSPMRNATCTNPVLRQFFDQGVTVESHWYDKDYVFVDKIRINKYDC